MNKLPEVPEFYDGQVFIPPFFIAGGVALLAGMLLGEFWSRFERIWK